MNLKIFLKFSKIKPEAQLPQRNSASATHDYLGWSADLLMITLGDTNSIIQCTEHNRIAEVALFFDIQTL